MDISVTFLFCSLGLWLPEREPQRRRHEGRELGEEDPEPEQDDEVRPAGEALVDEGLGSNSIGIKIRPKIGPRVNAEILFLKHESSIFRQLCNPVCGFSMMEQVRLCAVWPMENWLGTSMNHIQRWMTV